MSESDVPPALNYTGVYLTYSDLASREMSEAELVERLSRLSADDCIAQIANLCTRLEHLPGSPVSPEVQRRLIQEVAGDGDLAKAFEAALSEPAPLIVFSEQQLLHLARLVMLHADSRPHDDFNGGHLYDEWVTCLVGVTDLLDAGLQVEDRDERLSWELRQCGLNHHEDLLPVVALYYEVLRDLWPKESAEQIADVEAAFRRHAGLEMGDFFAIGTAVQARLMAHGRSKDGLAAVNPEKYFETTELRDAWEPFFELSARDLAGMKVELEKEDEQFGETRYSSLTFERFPLFKATPGVYLPISMNALQRRITQGIFTYSPRQPKPRAKIDGHTCRRSACRFRDQSKPPFAVAMERRAPRCQSPRTRRTASGTRTARQT